MTNEYRGYKLEADRKFGNIHIKNIGKGKLPVALEGSYTNKVVAKQAIDALLAKRATKNGKAK